MNIELNIGSAESASIRLEHDSVSFSHAILILDDKGNYIIRDNSSTNGIFVNDRRVKQFLLSENDTVRIGDIAMSYSLLLEKAEPHLIKHRTEFTPEYSKLILQMDQFESEKQKIKRPPLWPAILRGSLIGGCLLYMGFNPRALNQPIGLIMGIGIIGSIVTIFVKRSSKEQQKIDKLKLRYESILQCPKCKSSLLGQSSILLRGRTKCFNNKCDAEYTISSIQTQ